MCYDEIKGADALKPYIKNSYKDESEAIALVIKNVGYQTCEPGYQWGPGIRDHCLIHYVVSGSGTLTVGGRSFPVEKNQAFLILPDQLVSYQASQEDPWEYYWLGFSTTGDSLLRQLGMASESPVLPVKHGRLFRQYILDIYDSRGTEAWNKARMLGNAYLLLAMLAEEHGISTEGQTGQLVQKAADFMENNYANNITVEDTAEFAGVSRSSLYRAFMEQLNCSPSRYLCEIRMEHAKRLLRDTELRINEVAHSVGIADALYFSRLFLKETGVSPSAYRR